ncbi:ATP-binding protein [Streptococcus parasuis]|uniref:AAA family ATPase n=1 Tax=Streptococcus TaxID=1301 RepID=UPI00240D9585|nr:MULTISPECIES: AAA family ATPase [Streptococcus]WFB92274.1 ATP-binding protein [Streptococcus parasuis]WFB94211.1 ATP-binding protein [Streptococcus suis]WFB94256.1 ATP-binding protein [Streptococcus suis]
MKKRNFDEVDFYIESWPIDLNKLENDGFYFAKDNWDDFNFKTTYQVAVKFGDVLEDLGYINLSTFPYSNIFIDFKKVKSQLFEQRIISLGNKTYYEFLNRLFDSENRMDFFKVLGDLASNPEELKSLYENPNYTRISWKVAEVDLIRNSFFRNNNYNEVLTQYYRLTQGGKFQEAYQIELRSSDNEEVFSFNVDPYSLFPDTLYAIIGNNGSGKTHFIIQLINLYLEQTGKKEETDTIYHFSASTRLNEFKSLICVSYSPFDSDFPRLEYDNYKFIGIDFDSEDNLSKQITRNISNLLEEAGNRYREQLEKILSKFSFDPWFIEISSYMQNGNGVLSEEEIAKLSSGQKIILLNLLNLIINVSEKTLVIIDEPELFLHPPLLKAYIRAIEEIVREGNGACLLATHSSTVLQEIPHINVRKLYFDKENNVQTISPVHLKTFGENISSINDFVFGTDLRNTGFFQLLTKMIESSDEVPHLLKDVLGDEASVLVKLAELGKVNVSSEEVTD